MQRRHGNWNGAGSMLAALLMLATGTGTGRADEPPANTDPPKPLPENIVKAWEEAGAQAS